MKVFVVMRGEEKEGGSVEGVFKTQLGARKYVCERWETTAASHDIDEETGVERWEMAGCDYVEIQPHEVQ